VFGLTGELVAVLGIAAPTQRLTPAKVPDWAPAVVAAAADVSARLGHRPPKS
jgi:IclR family acetate operon transcriptional repressor